MEHQVHVLYCLAGCTLNQVVNTGNYNHAVKPRVNLKADADIIRPGNVLNLRQTALFINADKRLVLIKITVEGKQFVLGCTAG